MFRLVVSFVISHKAFSGKLNSMFSTLIFSLCIMLFDARPKQLLYQRYLSEILRLNMQSESQQTNIVILQMLAC